MSEQRKDKAGKILKLKQGRFSADEVKFLKQNGATWSVADLAKEMNRAESTIKKWMADNGIKNEVYYDICPERSKIKTALLSEPFWLQINQQFVERERNYFVSQYCEHIIQMAALAEVEYTEKMQVMHLIRNEIMLDRVYDRQKRSKVMQMEYEKKLAEAEAAMEYAEAKRCHGIIQACEHEFSSHGKEVKDLADKIASNRKDLKVTREQKMDNIKEKARNFETLVVDLQNEKFRQEEGAEINVFRAAMEVEKERLSKWHEFADGEEDIPLLTPENVDRIKRKSGNV